ncbi:hypothetical protein SV7mr_18460 [Stieleria bergensis]|uniref:Uncharacterized protein n=1 Tax=Stieleria bergensis TaxID=2528025 RepID=A0A517ST89_9BACT|nr:hypothetical protein SV7mr_18460 [Planctomycetes bacterium SV_7m_r]
MYQSAPVTSGIHAVRAPNRYCLVGAAKFRAITGRMVTGLMVTGLMYLRLLGAATLRSSADTLPRSFDFDLAPQWGVLRRVSFASHPDSANGIVSELGVWIYWSAFGASSVSGVCSVEGTFFACLAKKSKIAGSSVMAGWIWLPSFTSMYW